MTPVNAPVDLAETLIAVNVRECRSCRVLHLSLDELAVYNKDPDAFVAARFDISVAAYREWCEMEGVALCGATTRKGKPCRAALGVFQNDPHEWLSVHRAAYCAAHGG